MATTVVLTVTLAACALPIAAAWAAFGPIQLQSVGPLDQFESAAEPAVSADGHYLAFEGTLDGVRGIYRKDLHTGQPQLVAGGSIYKETGAPTDASAPSISADGRYVSFTTSDRLDPVDDTGTGSSVYVRDMDVAAPIAAGGAETMPCTAAAVEGREGARCAYELASALDDKRTGLTYSGGGALATGRVALSASGREVAFVIRGESNLTSEEGGSTPGVKTPPLQVAVRYLDSERTVLVSAERDPNSGQMTGLPVEEGAVTSTGEAPGAALSADGTTVAWLGAHIPAQAPTLSDERSQIEHDDGANAPSQHYDEPLWRRIADGATAPTRRIVGGGDPLAPGCPVDGTLAIPACQGPFPGLASELRGDVESNLGWLTIPIYDGVPQLSADGRTVALIGDPPRSTSNVFVADMHEGLDRVQALRQLTREVPVPFVYDPVSHGNQYLPTAGDIYDIGISPDGSRIAFTTQREQFPLSPPYFAESPLTQLGVLELYQIDLHAESLVRVTHGPGGGPSLAGGTDTLTSKGAAAPSYTTDGRTLAFADTAFNLVFGDGNEASDVFTVTDTETVGIPGQVAITQAPPPRDPPIQWRLSVVAITHADGTATLDVVIPGAGTVHATATASVPSSVHAHLGRAHLRASARRPAKRRGRNSAHRAAATTSRTVASTGMSAGLPGLLELPLRVGAPYARLLNTPTGIYTMVRVTFTGAGGPPLAQTVAVALHSHRMSARKVRRGGRAAAGRPKTAHGAPRR